MVRNAVRSTHRGGELFTATGSISGEDLRWSTLEYAGDFALLQTALVTTVTQSQPAMEYDERGSLHDRYTIARRWAND
jgi:hypothetical protein